MTVPEVKKVRGLAEGRAERRSEALGSERLPDVLGMRHELDAETAAGLQAGHEALQTMGNVNETGVDFPPELRLKIKEIQKEAAGKLRGLDATLSRMKEQFLSTANFLSGGLFETGQPRAREQNKFATGFYRDKKGKSIGKQERSKLESKVDMQLVRERATDVREYLTDRIHSSDVVLLGEIHSHETIEKRAVASLLEQAKASGTTHVGVEIPAYYQEAVDRYMATGKLDEEDDPADYERVDEYHRLYSEQLAQPEQPKQADKLQKDEFGKYEVIQPEGMTDELFAFERKMRKNFLFKNHLSKDFRLLQGIREAGLTPVCLDANASYGASQELDSGLDAVGRDEMTMDELKKTRARVGKTERRFYGTKNP